MKVRFASWLAFSLFLDGKHHASTSITAPMQFTFFASSFRHARTDVLVSLHQLHQQLRILFPQLSNQLVSGTFVDDSFGLDTLSSVSCMGKMWIWTCQMQNWYGLPSCVSTKPPKFATIIISSKFTATKLIALYKVKLLDNKSIMFNISLHNMIRSVFVLLNCNPMV